MYVDKNRIDRVFQVEELVYLSLQPYRQSFLKKKGAEKLQLRFYGPYNIIRKVGEVPYELDFPANRKIHIVFHVSCLKKAVGKQIVASKKFPSMDDEGYLVLVP